MPKQYSEPSQQQNESNRANYQGKFTVGSSA